MSPRRYSYFTGLIALGDYVGDAILRACEPATSGCMRDDAARRQSPRESDCQSETEDF